MNKKRFLQLAKQLLIVVFLGLVAAYIEQPFLIPVAKATGSAGTVIGLISGFFLFMAIFLYREKAINSTQFRALYMVGCLGFAILASEKIFVLALENAFLIDLGYSIYVDIRRRS